MTKKIKDEKITTVSQIVHRRGEHPKFIKQNVKLLAANMLPYYAEFNTYINYFESTNLPTCGVNVTRQGMNFYWNRRFVDSLTDTEALFLILHEDFHLLFDHTKRSIHYDKELSNVVQDMIINQIIRDEMMVRQSLKDHISIPIHHNKYIMDKEGNPVIDKDNKEVLDPNFGHNTALFIPKEYPGLPIFENLFQWMKEQQENKQDKKKEEEKKKSGQKDGDQKEGGKGKGDGKGDPSDEQGDGGGGQGDPSDEQGDGQGQSTYGENGRNGVECSSLDSILESLEKGEQLTIDTHIDDDVPPQARKAVIGDFMQRLKNRGLVSSDVEAVLNQLRKSKHDYLKEIKRAMTHHVFGTTKRKAISRPHRRGLEGVKGKKKFRNVINCILDTSGSMGGDFEKVLSYIYQNDISVNLIQIDTVVKVVEDIKSKKDLTKLRIRGGGGTILQPAVSFIADKANKLSKINTVILTDGYTDTLDFSNVIGKVLILTTGVHPRIIDPRGNVKSIIIDKANSINEI